MSYKDPTPEQEAYRREVDERSRRIQERGVPAPKGKSYGEGKTEKKKDEKE